MAKTKQMDRGKCGHCKSVPAEKGYWISCSGYYVGFCQECYKDWFNFRDKIVVKAFQEFINEGN